MLKKILPNLIAKNIVLIGFCVLLSCSMSGCREDGYHNENASPRRALNSNKNTAEKQATNTSKKESGTPNQSSVNSSQTEKSTVPNVDVNPTSSPTNTDGSNNVSQTTQDETANKTADYANDITGLSSEIKALIEEINNICKTKADKLTKEIFGDEFDGDKYTEPKKNSDERADYLVNNGITRYWYISFLYTLQYDGKSKLNEHKKNDGHKLTKKEYAYVMYEARHYARTITRYHMEDKDCLEALLKRDFGKYHNKNGATFKWLLGKYAEEECEKLKEHKVLMPNAINNDSLPMTGSVQINVSLPSNTTLNDSSQMVTNSSLPLNIGINKEQCSSYRDNVNEDNLAQFFDADSINNIYDDIIEAAVRTNKVANAILLCYNYTYKSICSVIIYFASMFVSLDPA